MLIMPCLINIYTQNVLIFLVQIILILQIEDKFKHVDCTKSKNDKTRQKQGGFYVCPIFLLTFSSLGIMRIV